MKKTKCRVCQTETEPEDLTHLNIYVSGSEGVDVCMTCRQTLTEVLRGMIRANASGFKLGYVSANLAGGKPANASASGRSFDEPAGSNS